MKIKPTLKQSPFRQNNTTTTKFGETPYDDLQKQGIIIEIKLKLSLKSKMKGK